jgi:hypothetical protein
MVDTRLDYYRGNCRRVPSVTGHVVPERIFTVEGYETDLLERLYRDIAPLDPGGVLQHEWLNARGAIARFDRGAIEIRLLDVQESPRADLAVVTGVVAAVAALVGEELSSGDQQRKWDEQDLEVILLETVRRGPDAIITDTRYLTDLGMAPTAGATTTARDVWRHLIGRTVPRGDARDVLDRIVEEGCLAQRILAAVPGVPNVPERKRLESVYRILAACLDANGTFPPDPDEA